MSQEPHQSTAQELIEQFQSGNLSSIELGRRLLQQSLASDGSVTPDLDRERRCGFPEVIFGQGKPVAAIQKVVDALLPSAREVLITRIAPEQVRPLSELYPFARWNHTAGTLRIGRSEQPIAPELIPLQQTVRPNRVAVVTAGTTDETVAMEALETLAWMNVPSMLIQDVGVAGPYRLLARVQELQSMRVIVCIAGMEGALPSMLAGYVGCPVIAVPTSVGYGANFAGLSALLSMLNSCAANVAVVNIDAGFKGAYLAGLIATERTF